MRLSIRFLVSAGAVFFALFSVVTVARGETCTLKVKRLSNDRTLISEFQFREGISQNSSAQIARGTGEPKNFGDMDAFKRIVTKEPKYQSVLPFRGVANFDGQEFAFALDGPLAEEKKPDVKKTKKDEGKKEGAAAGKAAAPKGNAAPPVTIYSRLYFDLNHNGDLTDDKVIEADPKNAACTFSGGTQSFSSVRFPRVDVTWDTEGKKTEYSFFLEDESLSLSNYCGVWVRLDAGSYLEGEITLDGKKRRVALIDSDSNGHFGDDVKLVRQFPRFGDMVLIDPKPDDRRSPFEMAASDTRHYMSKMICIDGKFYDLKISPAGDKLTLEPSSKALGMVTNPNGAYRAVLHGDGGFVKICGGKDKPAALPEGEWRLLSYAIERLDAQKSKEVDGKESETKSAKQGESKDALSKRLQPQPGSSATPDDSDRLSTVSAAMIDLDKRVKVVKGETVVMPFGPPYKQIVTVKKMGDGKQQTVSLGLSLVGSVGETCEDMTVHGKRPPKPTITITDTKGNVVHEGCFEYG